MDRNETAIQKSIFREIMALAPFALTIPQAQAREKLDLCKMTAQPQSAGVFQSCNLWCKTCEAHVVIAWRELLLCKLDV